MQEPRFFKRNRTREIRKNLNPVFVLLLLFVGFAPENSFAQPCDPSTPSFIVNLTGSPDSIWISSAVKRSGNCCGTSSPDRCIEFFLTLDSGAQGFRFDIASGAQPSGALFYQVECGPPQPVGTPLCLSTPGPHRITFCKPGSNLNQYRITSIAKPGVSPPTVVSDGCSAELFATNYQLSTITWTSIPFNATYNGYLDCTSQCDTVQVRIDTADSPPPFIDYQVSGIPIGGCNTDTVFQTVRVFFVSDKFVEILPKDPSICFGGSAATITANGNGGAPPYAFLWSTGETTASIDVGVGTYSVIMTDSTDCPPVYDTVVVTANPSPIAANAGPDLFSCKNNAPIALQGSVIVATGGRWSGGGGTFNPHDSSLTAVYTPTAGEITAGSVTLTLTTTGNGICPAETDNVTIFYNDAPIVSSGGPYTVCSNNAQVVLNGSVTNAGGGRWSGGAGTFSPHDSSLVATYTPTAAEITAGTLNLTLTSIQNGNCIPVDDVATITFTPAPVVDPGPDHTVCGNNADVLLNATITVASGGVWSGGTGTFSAGTTGLINNTYSPSAAEIQAGTASLTLTSTGNGTCLAVDSTILITITPAPVVDPGPDHIVCGNNADVLLNASITVATGGLWSGGGGIFSGGNTGLVNNTYSPSAAEITAGSASLTLTSTGNGNCLAVDSTIQITITPAPTIDAGPDTNLCANVPVVPLNGLVTVATGGTWSGGTGAFAPSANSLTGTYTPSPAEITAGSVKLFLTSTGNGTCLAVQDSMIASFAPAPTVSAGNDTTICGNAPTVNLNGNIGVATGGTWSGGAGTFNPSNTDLNAIYTPTAAEITAGTVTLTLTTTGNGICAAVSDDVVITILPGPTVNSGPDQVVCSTAADVTLAGSFANAGGIIWSGGGGSFNPGNTDPMAVYSPSATEISNGSAQLIITTTGTGTCPVEDDTLNISIIPGPQASAGPDITECANNVSITLNGSVTDAGGGIWFGVGSFLPNNTTLNADYIPTPGEIAGVLSALILETTGNGICPADRDTLTIIFTPAPVADAGPDDTVCANNTLASLNGSFLNATSSTWIGGAGTYTPNPPNQGAVTYDPSAGEIALGFVDLVYSATRTGCNPDTDTMRLFIPPAPVVNAGQSQTVCANNANTNLNGSVIGATGGQWTTSGTGTFSPNSTTLNAVYTPSSADTTAGSVILTLTSSGNGNCLPVEDTMVITITPAPVVDAGPPVSICENNAVATLSGSVSIATGGTWSGGAGTYTPNANDLNAQYIPTAAEISNGSVTLTLTSTGNGDCTPVTDVVTITITPAPIVDAGNDTTVCSDNSSVTLAGNVTGATGGQWTGGTGVFSPDANTLNAMYTPSATEISNGSVSLTLISTGNGNCNPVSDVMTITIGPPPTVDAGPDQDVCGDLSSVSLNGIVTIASGGTWTSSGTGTFTPDANTLNAVYNPTSADTALGSITLTLTTTGNQGCNARTDMMDINFISAPTVDAGPDQNVCTNDFPVQLAGSGSLSNWSGGAGAFSPDASTLNATYTPTPTEVSNGSVTLTLTTVANAFCPSISDNVTINLFNGPTVDAGGDQVVCEVQNIVNLSGFITNASGGAWTTSGSGTFDNPNAIITNYNLSAFDKSSGSVILVLTSTGNGFCTAETDTVVVTILPEIIANAGPDLTACADAGGINIIGNVTGANGGIWTRTGTGTFSPSDTSLNVNYIPSAADTAAGSVLIVLTTTGNNGCPSDQDSMILTITPAPKSFPGNDITVCADVNSVPLNGSVTRAAGGIWSSSGTGFFSPSASSLLTNYIPSNADTAAGQVYLSLTTTGNGTCNPVVDSLLLTIDPAPKIDAGPDLVICSDNLSVALAGSVTHATGGTWSSSGSGSFSPNANDLNAIYTFSNADSIAGIVTITLTSTGNGTCNAVTDDLIITTTPAPTISAGGDITVCANTTNIPLNGSVTVSSGAVWTTSGTGSFSPSNTALNASYVPSAADTVAGQVTLTISSTGNGNCSPVNDSIVVTFQSLPVVAAGPDTTVCSDIVSFGLNGIVFGASGGVWSSNGTGIFSPAATDLNASYAPSSADSATGALFLTLTATGTGVCPAISDQFTLNLTPGIVVDAGPDATVCADTNQVVLTGTVTNAGGGFWTSSGTGVFVPDSSDLNASYIPSAFDTAAGAVVLTLTSTGNGLCNPVSDNLMLTFNPAPFVFAGPDQTLCADQGALALSGQVFIASGGAWSTNGAGSFSPSNSQLLTNYLINGADTAAGSIEIYLTSTGNGICSAEIDTLNIAFQPEIQINAGPDQTLCSDVISVQLAGSLQNSPGASWTSTGTGTFSPSPNDLNAIYVPSTADDSLGFVTLRLTSAPIGACDSVFDEMLLTLTPAPTVDAGLDQTICASSPTINLNGSVAVATGGQWSTSSGFGSFSPNNTTLNATFTPTATQISNGTVVITLTTTGNGGCNTYTDNMVLTIQPDPVSNAGPDVTICADNPSLPLSGTVIGASGGTWSTTGSGSFAPDDTTLNGSYIYSLADQLNGGNQIILTTNGNGVCPADMDTLDLIITPAPTISANVDTACVDESGIDFSGTVTVASGLQWSSSGTGTFTPTNTALNITYTPSAADLLAGQIVIRVVSTGNGNCNQVSDSIILFTNPAPVVDAGLDKVVCEDNPTTNLNGSFTIAASGEWTSLGGGTFSPNPNVLNPSYTASALDISNGFVDLVLTTNDPAICAQGSDTVRVIITTAPTIDAGLDVVQCEDRDTIVLSAMTTIANGGIWSSQGTGFFQDSTALSTQYFASAGDKTLGSFYLIVTSTGNGLCNAVTDSLLVTLNPGTSVDAGADIPICEDVDTILFTAVIGNASGGVWSTTGAGTIIPSTTALSIQYLVDTADYTAGGFTMINTTTGNGDCFAAVDSSTITFEPLPTATITVPNACATDTVNLVGTFTNADTAYWTSSGTGTFIPDTISTNVQYIPSAADILAGSVLIAYQTIGATACFDGLDTANLNLSPPPEAIAGAADTVCADTSGYALTGVINNATGGIWSTTGSGNFQPNPTTLNATYVPSAADTAAGLVGLILTSTGNGLCSEDRDTLWLTITPAPFVNAGPGIVCDNNAILNINGTVYIASGGLWSTGGDGTFGNVNQLSTTYTLGTNDLIAGTVILTLSSTGNGQCRVATDTMTINVTPPPQAFAGNDTTICGDQLAVTLNGSVITATGGAWTSLGTGSFNDSTLLNAIYTFSAQDIANDSVILVLNTTGNGSCLPDQDSIIIRFGPIPTVFISDTTICSNAASIPLSGTVTVATGGIWTGTGTGNFVPPNSLSTNYNPSAADLAAGSIQAILTSTGNGGCNAYSDTIDLFFTPQPTVSAGTPQTVCADTAFLQLSGSLSNAGGVVWTSSGNGMFNDSSLTNAQYVFSALDTAAGSDTFYIETTGNGNCPAAFDTVVALITPAPFLDAGPDFTVCADTSVIPLNANFGIALGVQWATSNGTGVFNPGNTDPSPFYNITAADTTLDTLIFTVETRLNGDCKTKFDTVNVAITPAPTLSFTPNTICSQNPNIQLNAQFTQATGILWSTSGTGSFIPNTTDPMAIYVRSSGDSALGSIFINGVTTGNGLCRAVYDSLLVNFIPAPEADAGLDQQLCANEDTVQLSGTVITALGGIWTSSGTGSFTNDTSLVTQYLLTPQDKIDSLITIYLSTTGNGACLPDVDSLQIAIVSTSPVANAGTDIIVCADVTSIQLNGSITGATGGTWTGNGGGFFSPNANDTNAIYFPVPADTLAGVVNLALTTTGNGICAANTDSVDIIFASSPLIDAGPDQTICQDFPTASLAGVVSGGNPIIWSSSGTGVFSDSSDVNSTYTASPQDITDSVVNLLISTTGANGCQVVTDQMKIFIRPGPTADAGFPTSICADESSVSLNGSFTNAGGIVWSTLGTGTFSDTISASTTYFPSPADTVAGFVDLIITTTANSGCNPADDTVRITINPGVTINAGPDQVVCSNTTSILLSGSVSTATGGQWSSLNGGIFSPSPAGLSPQYFFDSLDYLSDSIYLTITSTGNGSCFAKSDSMKVNFVPNPTVDAGLDQVVCEDNAIANLNGTVLVAGGGQWISSGTGTFSPSDTSLNATYTLSAADIAAGAVNIALTTIQNGQCDSVTDFVNISVTPAPTVIAGGDQTICYSESSVILSGIATNQSSVVWSSTGTGNFLNPSALNTSYIPSTADKNSGMVSLILTVNGNGTCVPVTDTVEVIIRPVITADAGIDQTICADVPFITLNGNISGATSHHWSTSGTGTFSPSAAVLAPQYFVSSPDIVVGSVGLTISTDSLICPPVSDGMVLNITPAPTIDVGADLLVCESEDSVQLSATFAVAGGVSWTSSGTGTFSPSANVQNPVYLPSAADTAVGNILITATTTGNGTCQPVSDGLLLSFKDDPIAKAGFDITICAIDSLANLNGIILNAGGGFWTSSGSGIFLPDPTDLSAVYQPSPTDTAQGFVDIILETTLNDGCPQDRDTIRILIDPEPVVTTGDVDACADEAGIQLNGTIWNAQGGLWTTSGSGVFAPSASTLGVTYVPSQPDFTAGLVTLTLTSTGSGACPPAADDATVIITQLPVADGGADQTICRGDMTTLVPIIDPGNSYSWFTLDTINIGNDPLVDITASTDTAFIVQVTDVNGCQQTDTAFVFVIDPPQFSLDPHFCYEEGLVISSNPSFDPLLGTYQWSRNDTILTEEMLDSLLVAEPGNHEITYNYESCNQTASTMVTLPPALDPEITYACDGDTTIISIQYYPKANYLWTLEGTPVGGDTSQILGVATDSLYYNVLVTDSLTCQSQDSVLLVPVPPPVLPLEDVDACIGDVVTLDGTPVNVVDTLKSTYQWYQNGIILPSDTFPRLQVRDSGMYQLDYALGTCEAEDSSFVTFNELPIPDNDPREIFCKEISPTVSLDAGPASRYYWFYTGDTTRFSDHDDFGYFYFEIYNEFDCKEIDSILVEENCPPLVHFPNAFSPNGDNIDDFYRIFGSNFSNMEFRVYNRWGEVIFQATSKEEVWDGTFRGEEMPPGVYPWTATWKGIFPGQEGPYDAQGQITLIR